MLPVHKAMEVLSLGVGHLNLGHYHQNQNSRAAQDMRQGHKSPLTNPTDQGLTSRRKAAQNFEPETEIVMSTMSQLQTLTKKCILLNDKEERIPDGKSQV